MGKWGNRKVAGSPAALGLALSLALGGCAKQEFSSSPARREYQSYIQQSCAFLKDEGAPFEASAASADINTEDSIQTGPFGRKYNRDWLSSVGKTSLVGTAKFIESLGLKIYLADPVTEKSCKNLDKDFIEPMPEDIASKWYHLFVGSSAAMITAMYFDQSQEEDLPSLHDHAAIVIRADGSRWSLLHEMMHHNFKVHDSEKETSLQVWKQKNQYFEQIKGIRDSSRTSEEKVKAAAPIFFEFSKMLDREIAIGVLEEIAVDATLQQAYDHAELTYVSPVSYENALWYIHQSQARVIEAYAAVNDIYSYFRKLAAADPSLKLEYETLGIHETLRDARLTQMKAIVEAREVAAKSFGMGFIRMGLDREDPSFREGVFPCPEAALRLKELERFTQSLKKNRPSH